MPFDTEHLLVALAVLVPLYVYVRAGIPHATKHLSHVDRVELLESYVAIIGRLYTIAAVAIAIKWIIS